MHGLSEANLQLITSPICIHQEAKGSLGWKLNPGRQALLALRLPVDLWDACPRRLRGLLPDSTCAETDHVNDLCRPALGSLPM